jgi:hypothetical protein
MFPALIGKSQEQKLKVQVASRPNTAQGRVHEEKYLVRFKMTLDKLVDVVSCAMAFAEHQG